MIGHLQRNKVHQVIDRVVLIYPVDPLRLTQQIETDAVELGLNVDILLKVNVARGEGKYEFLVEEVEDTTMQIKDFSHVHIKGPMTIMPFVDNSEEDHGIFEKLSEFAVDIGSKNIDNIIMSVPSMGMIENHKVAIEEGATMVKVGASTFGTR